MEIDKPLVSILMAVYKPNSIWFREQLESLNNQTYSNLELVIYNDCPQDKLDESMIREIVKKFPYRIINGEKNLGSNKAFEILTQFGEGKYFSYCDQDDVWHKDKIQKMADVLEKTNSPMVCSDLAVIDGDDNKIANSITDVRKRHVFYDGEDVTSHLLVRNFVTGCAMMMKSDVAKKSIPFVDSLVHDHWLAINASLYGKIEIIRESLIDYRQHSNNQTGVLKGVKTKTDYYNARIENMRLRIEDYKTRLIGFNNVDKTIVELETFNNARSRYFYSHKRQDRKIMNQYKYFAPQDIMLEKIMPFLPNFIMKMIFGIIRKGWI